MQCDRVAFGHKLINRHVVIFDSGTLTGRVTDHYPCAEQTSPFGHYAAYIAASDHPQSVTDRVETFAQKCAPDILGHARCVAARSVVDRDTPLRAPRDINLVHTDGSGGDEAHAAVAEKRLVTESTRSDHDGIRVADILGGESELVDIERVGHRFKPPLDIGDIVVDDYFHGQKKNCISVIMNDAA